MLNLVMSAEDLATELPLAAADVAIEQNLPAPTTGLQVEAIATLTDQFATDRVPEHLPVSLGPGMEADEQIALLSEVKDKVTALWDDFTEWRTSIFQKAKDKLSALAEKLTETAVSLGVSVEHLIGRLQRRVTAFLIDNTVVASLEIGTGSNQVLFTPSGINVTTTVKSSPSLASMDLTGVVKLLSGLLGLEIDVSVTYGVKS